ncbi:predicted protein [Naegleria gruberi]|uniref:Predicted protein n=1 Tax=Naegleria gruberi TaxID=5762 RepID=D2VXM4_NAEGR|nr:uncharacterized protein NAEGRDRAFT_73802 [Naegleria gruberi]EFC38531.1 predicted protein [Naegleria gruberi]|eukprot:XP_002671275.1 predicted protein [Naegleria gruberi strain NEG-M]
MKIEPHTLSSLFKDPSFGKSSQIQIPIYQRKYCWNSKIVKQLYNDLVFNGTSFGHHIGKLFFQKKLASRVCIDGQQRLTTLLIGICALRDAALELVDSEKILDEIHSYIFVKSVDLKKLQEEYLSSEDKYAKASEIAKNVSRLIPSHDDRVSNIEILIGFKGDQTNLLQNSNMHNTRQIFYKIFKSQLVKQQVNSLAIVKSSLIPILTINGKFVIIEYEESEINAQECFGERYDVGKSNQILFYIKTPGIDLSYSDLIKNHLLSKLDETKQIANL